MIPAKQLDQREFARLEAEFRVIFADRQAAMARNDVAGVAEADRRAKAFLDANPEFAARVVGHGVTMGLGFLAMVGLSLYGLMKIFGGRKR